MDCFTKLAETYAIPNKEASVVMEAVVINFFCTLEYCGSSIMTRAITSSPV
jgi:hypothetical protein